MNSNTDYSDITIASTMTKCVASHIDEDIILFEELAKLPFPTEPRRMGCIFVGLCLQGTIQHEVNTVQHTCTPHTVILISPGQVVDNYLLSPDFKGVGFMLSPDFYSETAKELHELSSLFLFARTHPVSMLDSNEADTFLSYFRMLKNKIDDTAHRFRRDVVRMTIATMIYDLGNTIYRIMQNSDKRLSRAELLFSDFIRLVEQHFRSERRVGWYSQQLCITPKYLSESVRQVSRRTPNEWIDNYVVMEIRIMLKNSRMSIKEIARTLQFPNQSFLGKFFKEHTGLSPTEYRRS